MAKENKKPALADQEEELDLERLKKRLDMLDQRLDSIDSVVTAVVERVMKQPLSFNVTCSKCGHSVEIALIGVEKPRR